MINPAYALNAYTQTKVETTTNPVDLIIMLYDGSIEFLDKAVTGMSMKEIQIKLKYIDKALAIIEELQNSLNIETGGEIALNLQDLYYYMMKEITLANIHNDSSKLLQVTGLLKELRGAWIQIRSTV